MYNGTMLWLIGDTLLLYQTDPDVDKEDVIN